MAKGMSTFKGKAILLIAPEFYTYHLEIISSLKSLGAEVTFCSEKEHSLSRRIAQKISKTAVGYLERTHKANILNEMKNSIYDFVFVIRGVTLTPDFLTELRLHQPHTKFIMYQWDSYSQNDYREMIPFFDVVATFDVDDAKELNLNYEPLFYTNEYCVDTRSDSKKTFDLVFYGAYHSDRLTVIKYFDDLFRGKGLVFKSHLYIKKIPLLLRLLTGEIKATDLKYFKTYSVSSSAISQVYSESKAVLDVELTIQSGLSIRTFEVLGSGLKLVTTNANIMMQDFYSAEQIMVIDRSKLDVNTSFFTAKNSVIDMKKYHIDAWLERIFNYLSKTN